MHGMKRLMSSFIITSLMTSSVVLASSSEKPLSDEIKAEQKAVEQKQQVLKQAQAESKQADDKESNVIWNELDPVLEAKSRCFKESEEIEIRICIHDSVKKLADTGNFIAQDMMGKIYQSSAQNNEMAIRWYSVALKNPKTPVKYKEWLLKDIEKVEAVLKENDKSNKNAEKPLSEGMKQDMVYIATEQEMIAKQKRKAQLLEDNESVMMLDELDNVFSAQKPCFEKKEEHDINVCMNQQLKEMAQKGNYFAQHQLGNIYENSFNNKAMAIKWYNAALGNPKTPQSYKGQIESDLKRVKSKTILTDREKDNKKTEMKH